MLKRDFSDIVYRALADYFDVQVINSNIKRIGKKLLYVEAVSTTTVSAGSSETIQIIPPEGKVWKIENLRVYINPPSGATTGNHRLMATLKGKVAHGFDIKRTYSGTLEIVSCAPYLYDAIMPDDPQIFYKVVKSLVFKNDIPLELTYENNTDVDQTNARNITLIVEEFDEVS